MQCCPCVYCSCPLWLASLLCAGGLQAPVRVKATWAWWGPGEALAQCWSIQDGPLEVLWGASHASSGLFLALFLVASGKRHYWCQLCSGPGSPLWMSKTTLPPRSRCSNSMRSPQKLLCSRIPKEKNDSWKIENQRGKCACVDKGGLCISI